MGFDHQIKTQQNAFSARDLGELITMDQAPKKKKKMVGHSIYKKI